MIRTGDRRQDVLTNTRRLAVIQEEKIRAHPEQWLMFHPFWPELPPNVQSASSPTTANSNWRR
jgi:lauroyl/myristoyl acyltransferase